MTVALVRVDNRLLHGQVIEAWLPVLEADRIVVADDEAARNRLMRAALEICVPPGTDLAVTPVEEAGVHAADARRTLVLVREVRDAVRARAAGLRFRSLNVGNVHHAPGRRLITASIYLASDEVASLEALAAEGVEVDLRAVPTEAPLRVGEARARYERSAA